MEYVVGLKLRREYYDWGPQVAASGGTTYPVLADPWHVIWYIGYTSSGWQDWVMTGGVLLDSALAASPR